MKNLLNAHIQQTTFECSAEREIRLYKNAERRATASLIAGAIVAVGLLIAGTAYLRCNIRKRDSCANT